MTAAIGFIPFGIKPTHIFPHLPRWRPPNLTLSTTKSYYTVASTKSYYADADVSSHLLHNLSTTLHPIVKTPILRLLSSSIPPTIAPSLCLATAELVGGNPILALNAACALHLIHVVAHTRTAAIINHHPLTEFSRGTELLTRDELLALAYEMVAGTPSDDAEVATRLLKVLMQVATTATAVAFVDEKQREGKLAVCAAVCGAILGGGNKEEVERARRLGMFIGKIELAEAEVELVLLGFEEVKAKSN